MEETLVLAIAEQSNTTIVVLINGVGPLIFESWIGHLTVIAVCIHFCLCVLALNHSDRLFL
jgi:hypothetical protein